MKKFLVISNWNKKVTFAHLNLLYIFKELN